MVYIGEPPRGNVFNTPQQEARYYRRIPTRGTSELPQIGRQRGYYNPLTGETLTEHQYLRRYRRGLSYQVTTPTGEKRTMTPASIQQLEEQTRYLQDQNQLRRERLYQGYQNAEEVTYQQYQRLNNERIYYEYLKNQYRRLGMDDAERALLAPNGPFAQVLENMGLRPRGAGWMVGMSNMQPGWPAYYFPGRAPIGSAA